VDMEERESIMWDRIAAVDAKRGCPKAQDKIEKRRSGVWWDDGATAGKCKPSKKEKIEKGNTVK